MPPFLTRKLQECCFCVVRKARKSQGKKYLAKACLLQLVASCCKRMSCFWLLHQFSQRIPQLQKTSTRTRKVQHTKVLQFISSKIHYNCWSSTQKVSDHCTFSVAHFNDKHKHIVNNDTQCYPRIWPIWRVYHKLGGTSSSATNIFHYTTLSQCATTQLFYIAERTGTAFWTHQVQYSTPRCCFQATCILFIRAARASFSNTFRILTHGHATAQGNICTWRTGG